MPAVVSRARGASPGPWNLEGDCFSEVSGEQTVRGELSRRKRTGIVGQRRCGICAQPGLPSPLEAAGDCLVPANDGVVMAGNGVSRNCRARRLWCASTVLSRPPRPSTLTVHGDLEGLRIRPPVEHQSRRSIACASQDSVTASRQSCSCACPEGQAYSAVQLALTTVLSGRRRCCGALAEPVRSLMETKTCGTSSRRPRLRMRFASSLEDEIGYLPGSSDCVIPILLFGQRPVLARFCGAGVEPLP